MPRSLLLALIVLVAAPLVLLGWVTISAMQSRERMAKQQVEGLIAERLSEFDESITGMLERHARELKRSIAPHSDSIEALKTLQLSNPIVRQGLFVRSDGMLLFPSASLTEDPEFVALHSTLHALVDSRPAPDSEPVDGLGKSKPMQETPQQREISEPTKTISISFDDEHQWQVWYMDEGAQLVFWVFRSDGAAIGVLLERSRWMSDVVSILPDSRPLIHKAGSDEKTSTGYTALVDETQRVLYQWGDSMLNHSRDENQQPVVTHSVTEPLASWKLQYFSDGPLVASAAIAPVLLSLVSIGILLLALGTYVLTSVQRQMSTARNRVSFAGQVSHELRTPLTNIRLYTELAESDLAKLSDDETRQSLTRRLNVIDHESRRLQRLVSGVLEMIRDGDNRVGVRRSQVNANDLIYQTVQQFEPVFLAANITVDLELDTDTQINIDADVFEMILVNLLSNVEKYAGVNGNRGDARCRIQSSIDNGYVVVSVCDNGPGISTTDRRRVFQPFSRLDDSINAPSGTGIGLTIARRAAKRHGGDLVLLDNDRDRGAHFEFRLPLEDETEQETS